MFHSRYTLRVFELPLQMVIVCPRAAHNPPKRVAIKLGAARRLMEFFRGDVIK